MKLSRQNSFFCYVFWPWYIDWMWINSTVSWGTPVLVWRGNGTRRLCWAVSLGAADILGCERCNSWAWWFILGEIFTHVKSCWSLLLNCFMISSFLSLFAQSHLCKQKQLFLQMWMPRLDEPKPAQIISKGLKKQPSKTNKNPHQTWAKS